MTSIRTTSPISTKLGTEHPWVTGRQFHSNEEPCPLLRKIMMEIY